MDRKFRSNFREYFQFISARGESARSRHHLYFYKLILTRKKQCGIIISAIQYSRISVKVL